VHQPSIEVDHGQGRAAGGVGEVVARLRAAGCVFAEEEAELLTEAAGGDEAVLLQLVDARVCGQPLEHVLGWVAFAGRRLVVGPGVFVPRVRTELLAELAVTMIDDHSIVLELCCGVGAVAGALQHRRPEIELYAVDIDPVAVAYARRHIAAPGAVLLGDLFDPVPGRLHGQLDVIIANAPYVPTEAIELMPREARDHEPRQSLDGGADGADVHRRIIAAAPTWLRPGGGLLIETGREQSVITAAAMEAVGLGTEVITDDDRGGTVVVGTAELSCSGVASG
jgi:release factor glutamine methyltransferase